MPGSDLKINVSNNDAHKVAIVALEGYLDSHTFEALERTILEHFANKQYRMIIDLSLLEYVSSAGCGQFIAAVADSQAHGGNVIFVNPTETVAAALEIIGILDMMPRADTIEKALATFK